MAGGIMFLSLFFVGKGKYSWRVGDDGRVGWLSMKSISWFNDCGLAVCSRPGNGGVWNMPKLP